MYNIFVQFSKFKVILSFRPDINCILHIACKIIPWYTFECKVNDNLFKPMHLIDYYYNSKLPDFDYYETTTRKIPIVFPYSHKNKFIIDKTVNYPQWFGYFDSMLHANKEYKNHAKKQIIEHLKSVEHIEDKKLFDDINNYMIAI